MTVLLNIAFELENDVREISNKSDAENAFVFSILNTTSLVRLNLYGGVCE
ncbi:hypothetical protein BSM4216_2168 [Bacillus smithii]|nr:hypothetical protein BSM4216_2168 [Bacillus smithii]